MPLARWKDLCIDASDASALGIFWGTVLGRAVEHLDGDAVLRGASPAETIWINTVPEPRTVKHRLHIDIGADAVEPVVELGASVVLPAAESGFPWTVMTDPEGGEFCLFLRDDLPVDPPGVLEELVLDTSDEAASRALAEWWAEILGGAADDDGRGFWWVEQVPGLPFDGFSIVPVPEPKTVKNRLHWDLESDDLDALVTRGATVLAQPTASTPWHVCADPQGNEFCVFGSAR